MIQETNDEKLERIHLIQEIQISELILNNKNKDLKNENIRNENLKKKIEITDKKQFNEEIITKLKKDVEKISSINKEIENENNIKLEKLNQLLNKYNEGKPIPFPDLKEDKQFEEEEEYDNEEYY